MGYDYEITVTLRGIKIITTAVQANFVQHAFVINLLIFCKVGCLTERVTVSTLCIDGYATMINLQEESSKNGLFRTMRAGDGMNIPPEVAYKHRVP